MWAVGPTIATPSGFPQEGCPVPRQLLPAWWLRYRHRHPCRFGSYEMRFPHRYRPRKQARPPESFQLRIYVSSAPPYHACVLPRSLAAPRATIVQRGRSSNGCAVLRPVLRFSEGPDSRRYLEGGRRGRLRRGYARHRRRPDPATEDPAGNRLIPFGGLRPPSPVHCGHADAGHGRAPVRAFSASVSSGSSRSPFGSEPRAQASGLLR